MSSIDFKSNVSLSNKNLKTLKGLEIPSKVDVNFNCSANYLTSLEFGPKEVGNIFSCDNNELTSLEFGPEYVGTYYCDNNKLTSLEFCASKIGYSLYANDNSIENLKGIHIHFKNGYIRELLNLRQNPLKSHLLGIILIPELKEILISDPALRKIIKNHLKTKDVLECQEELIQNGFKEFAQL